MKSGEQRAPYFLQVICASPSLDYSCILEAGPRKIVRRLLHGERFAGMRDPKEGTDILLQSLLAEAPPGLTVCVTHDAILACVQTVLTGLSYEEAHWPGFLEGIWIDVVPSGLEVTWRNARYCYPWGF